jgi:hypothetical protein
MVTVKHRSASSSLDELWEYDPARRALDVVCRQGSVVRAFRVYVCTEQHPRIGAFVIARVGEDTWKLLPALCVPLDDGSALRVQPIQSWLTPGDQLLLTCAPPEICTELEELSKS